MSLARPLDSILDFTVAPGYGTRRIPPALALVGAARACRRAARPRRPGHGRQLRDRRGRVRPAGRGRSAGAPARARLRRAARPPSSGSARPGPGRGPAVAVRRLRPRLGAQLHRRLRGRGHRARRPHPQRRRPDRRAGAERAGHRADLRDGRGGALPDDPAVAWSARRGGSRPRRVGELGRDVHRAARGRQTSSSTTGSSTARASTPMPSGRRWCAPGCSPSGRAPLRAFTPCIPAGPTPRASTKSLPRFHKLMGPILRDSGQGADTAVWLMACPEAEEHPGALWHDRRVRSPYRVPGTRESARGPRGALGRARAR